VRRDGRAVIVQSSLQKVPNSYFEVATSYFEVATGYFEVATGYFEVNTPVDRSKIRWDICKIVKMSVMVWA
jgi:hypothetical protein